MKILRSHYTEVTKAVHPVAGKYSAAEAPAKKSRQRSRGWRIRVFTRRSEPRKYIFRDGKVQVNKNPFALLSRPGRESQQGGVILFVAAPPAEPKPKKDK